jgi:sirohydrochlorin cobaltochelatase
MIRMPRSLALFALILLVAPGAIDAQVGGRVGTIVIAHGGDSLWNEGVRNAAREARTGGPVEVSFLMGPDASRTRFQDAVARLSSTGVELIVVVPMLVSSHSGHYEQIRWLAGEDVALDETMRHHLQMSGIERAKVAVPIFVAAALDDSPEVAQILGDRALALARAASARPADRALLIVGHGPNSAEDYAEWMRNLRAVAERVKSSTGFRDVRVELVRDDAPALVRAEAVKRTRELVELQQLATGAEVLVVPILISKGSVSRDKLPADLAGTPSRYAADPLLPHPAIARWIESRVRALAAGRAR